MPERPSVLYICFDHIPSPKGASTHVTYFVQALAARYRVTLMSLGQADATGEYCGARHLAITLHHPNLLDRALAFREAVWDELEANRYDIVHFRTMWAALPIAEEKARLGFSTVCEVNAVESIELKYHYPALRARPELLGKLRAQEQTAFTAADVLVTPSEVTKNYLLHHDVEEERIRVISNGVDLDRFQPAPQPRTADDPLQLLYVGTLAPWQGLEMLLRALRQVIAQRPARLRIVGGGQSLWKKTVLKDIAKLGLQQYVELLPPAPHAEVPALINATDICLAPLAPTERNLSQGCCPVKLFEYMACAKPIIAANLPVVREILTHEEDALLFKVTKPARLAECILRLAEDADLRARLGEQALCKVREQFSWARAQDELVSVYSEFFRMENNINRKVR